MMSLLNYPFRKIHCILLLKLFWPTVRKNCFKDGEKLLKFKGKGCKFAIFLRSLEQFTQKVKDHNNFWNKILNLQVILFEIDCAIFDTNLHELFVQLISWTNWVNSGKFKDNCRISWQVMADMKIVHDDLIIINLYSWWLFKSNKSEHLYSNLQKLIGIQKPTGKIWKWKWWG